MAGKKLATIQVVVKDAQAKDKVIDLVKEHTSFKKATLYTKSNRAERFALSFTDYGSREILDYTKWIRKLEPVQTADTTVNVWLTPERIARLVAAAKTAVISFVGAISGSTATDATVDAMVTIESLSVNFIISSAITAF